VIYYELYHYLLWHGRSHSSRAAVEEISYEIRMAPSRVSFAKHFPIRCLLRRGWSINNNSSMGLSARWSLCVSNGTTLIPQLRTAPAGLNTPQPERLSWRYAEPAKAYLQTFSILCPTISLALQIGNSTTATSPEQRCGNLHNSDVLCARSSHVASMMGGSSKRIKTGGLLH
jgi:hypothetical protein